MQRRVQILLIGCIAVTLACEHRQTVEGPSVRGPLHSTPDLSDSSEGPTPGPKESPQQRPETRRSPTDRPATQRAVKVRSLRDIEFAEVDGQRIMLDMYLPAEPDPPFPVIVYIHGGGWQKGSRSGCGIKHMARRGYAVVSIDYRLTHEAIFPAQIHDCKGAIRWLRANADEYGLDPERIGVWGNSAGGHLAALLGTSGGIKAVEGDVGGNLDRTSRVQAVADFCGPTSFRLEHLVDARGKRTGHTPDPVVKLLGGTIQRKPGLARMASPLSFVSPDDPPFFIAHGKRDPTVPVIQAQVLATALREVGVETTLQIDSEAGHGVPNPKIRRMAADFFDEHLTSDVLPADVDKPASAMGNHWLDFSPANLQTGQSNLPRSSAHQERS